MKSGVGVGGAGRAGCCLPSPSPGPGMLGPQALSRRQEGGRLRWPAVGGGKGPLGSAPARPHRRRWVERQESPVGPPPPALHCLQGTCCCRRSRHRLVCFCGGPCLLPPEWEDRRARSVCVHCPIPSSCRPHGMRGLRREGGGGGQLAPPGVTPARLRRVVVWGPVDAEIRLQEPPPLTPALAVGPAWLCTPGCCPEQGPL